MVSESVQVQAEFPVAAVTKRVELARGRGDEGVVLPTGDCLHRERLQAGHQLRQGRLQDLVTQAKLAVAGQTETVNLEWNVREVRGERVLTLPPVVRAMV